MHRWITLFKQHTLVPSTFPDVLELKVRVGVIYLWLSALKHINPFYRNIEIIDTPAMRSQLEQITINLITNATVVENESDITIDRIATQEETTTSVEEREEDTVRLMPTILLKRDIPITQGQTDSVRTAFEGLMGEGC